MELHEHLDTLQSLNTEVWGISPDSDQDRLSSFLGKSELTFPLLIDAELEATKAYGILNEKQPKVPHPTVVIVDREGVVRFFHLDEDYTQRPAPSVILDALKELEAPAEAS